VAWEPGTPDDVDPEVWWSLVGRPPDVEPDEYAPSEVLGTPWVVDLSAMPEEKPPTDVPPTPRLVESPVEVRPAVLLVELGSVRYQFAARNINNQNL